MDLKRKLATLNPQELRRRGRSPTSAATCSRICGKKWPKSSRERRCPLRLEPSRKRAFLPFALEETEQGPLCRRHKVLPPSYHVGRMPVDAAKSARSELLALLALDPGLAACPLESALFLDTETSGLGGAGTVAFLIGLAWFDAEGRLNIEQLLLEQPGR